MRTEFIELWLVARPANRFLQIWGIRVIVAAYMTTRINYRTAAPDTCQALLVVHKHLGSVFPDQKLRALIELRVSQINGCAFCLDMHATEARHLGETQQRLDCV